MKNKKMKALSFNFNRRIALIYSAIFLLIGGLFAVSMLSGGAGFLETFLFAGSGAHYAIMAAVGNITRVTDKETSGSQIVARIWLVALDQIDDTVAFPRPNGNFEIGTIPLKPGEYMHYFEAIDNSPEDKSSGSKGDITTNVTNTFTFIVGGYRLALQRFMEDHPGDRFIIIYQMANDGQYYCIGNYLKPMVLKAFERTNGKDSRSVSFTFENTSFEQPKKYIGNIIREAPAVLAANATTLTIGRPGQYNTGANTEVTVLADVAGLATADEGRIIEIIGTGGSFPSVIEASDKFILKNSEDWTANAGSRISFRVLDDSTLVEQSRIQTA